MQARHAADQGDALADGPARDQGTTTTTNNGNSTLTMQNAAMQLAVVAAAATVIKSQQAAAAAAAAGLAAGCSADSGPAAAGSPAEVQPGVYSTHPPSAALL